MSLTWFALGWSPQMRRHGVRLDEWAFVARARNIRSLGETDHPAAAAAVRNRRSPDAPEGFSNPPTATKQTQTGGRDCADILALNLRRLPVDAWQPYDATAGGN